MQLKYLLKHHAVIISNLELSMIQLCMTVATVQDKVDKVQNNQYTMYKKLIELEHQSNDIGPVTGQQLLDIVVPRLC